MNRKALVRRIAECLFNEPATRRGAGAAPTRRACADFGRLLCCSSVKHHSGYSPSSRRASSQNSQQRCYTNLRLDALPPRLIVPRFRNGWLNASEALDTVEHLGLILKDQNKAATLLKHFGSIANLARASVQDLSAFLSHDKAAQLISSLRLAAVALREERTRLVIDTPLAVAELCAEMRFLSHESLRVILLNTKQELIKVIFCQPGNPQRSAGSPAGSL
jgi:hypothetical protein